MGVLGLLVAGVNLVLNLAVPGWIQEDPERLRVGWTVALTLWPGHVRVWGLRLEGTGRFDRWTLDLPYASGTIDLGALSARTFRASGVHTSGLRFDHALRDDPEPDRPGAPQGPWTVDLRGVTARHVRHVAVGAHRFDGQAVLTGDLTLGDDVDADLAMQVIDGVVTAAHRPLLSGVSGRTTARLVDLPRAGPLDRTALDRMEGTADLSFHADDLSVLGVYLQRAPWLRLSGEGDATVSASLVRGALAPGSRVEATTSDLTVGFRSYRIVGDASLRADVSGTADAPATAARATLGRFRILDETGASLVRGAGFEVLADAGRVTWSAPSEDLRIRLELPESQLEDPDAWGALLPSGAGMQLTGGSGTVRGSLQADTGAGEAHGSMHLAAADVQLAYDGVRMVSDLAVDIALPEADLDAGAYTFSGSTVKVLRFGDPERADDPRDWWATLSLERGVATVGADPWLDASLALDCASSGPLLDLATERAKVPGVVEDLLTVRDMGGRAGLELRRGGIVLRDLVLEGGAAEVRMDLLRQQKRTHAAVFARVGPLSVGIGVRPGSRTWHALGARSWFEANDVLDGIP